MVKKYIKITLFLLVFLTRHVCLGQVIADFSYTTSYDSCGSRSVQFDASKSTGALMYSWQFRNVTQGTNVGTGSGKFPSINFLKPGKYTATLQVTGAGGNTASKTAEIQVYDVPNVQFTTDVKEGCQPLKVKFKSTSTAGDGTIVQWEWNFNDGKKYTSTTGDTTSNLYENNGVFSPTLIVTNSFGCTKSLSIPNLITVYTKMTPVFEVSNNFSCTAPLVVSFKNKTSPGPFHYTWTFGDGNVLASDDVDVTHSYTAPGAFAVRLTATNGPQNCTSFSQSTGAKSVYLGNPPVSVTIPGKVCSGDSVLLAPLPDVSKLTNTGKWFFEDDHTVVNKVKTTHVFSKPGNWKVKYVAYNSFSQCASDTVTQIVQVLASPQPNFTIANPRGCQVPYALTIQNASTNTDQYQWDFGDNGNLSSGGAPQFSHQYLAYDTFVVVLKATNASGCVAWKKDTVVNAPLKVDFKLNTSQGCVPLTLLVTPNVTAGQFTYDFGNGTSVSTANTASQVYTTAGEYAVKVSVQTPEGCTAQSKVKMVSVHEYCDTYGDTAGLHGKKKDNIYVIRSRDCSKKYSFLLEDTTHDATVVSWDFDGDTKVTSQNPIPYTFPQDGRKAFLVTVNLVDNITHDPIVHKIGVNIMDQKANFVPSKLFICKDISIAFATKGIDSTLIVRYTWDFGDSTKAVIENAQYHTKTGLYLNGNTKHTYQRFGNFDVKLVIEDKFGCKDSLVYPNPIQVQSPVAKFDLDKTTFCGDSAAIVFTNTSTPNNAITEWKWDFGDTTYATFSKDTVVSHMYHGAGYFKYFNVKLTIKDASGCTDQKDTTISSYAPTVDFSTEDTLRCGKFDIKFTNTSHALVSDSASQYEWSYGNGQTSMGFQGKQVYADTGFYTVSLKVKDNGGCTATKTKKDYIRLVKPKAAFESQGDTTKCLGTYSTPFLNNSRNGISYFWDFGDSNTTVTDKLDVSNFYTKPGDFTVKLVTLGVDGCKDSTSKMVHIKGSSEKLKVQQYYFCLGDTFTAVVNGKNIKSYLWDFGDLSSTTDLTHLDSVSHVYTSPGKYYPNVILISTEGCQTTATVTDPVTVDSLNAGPDANIYCGDSTTELKGGAAYALSHSYVWEGPSGTTFIPNDSALTTKVTLPGTYILRSKNTQCGLTDTLEVTTSGVVPTADAGADKKLDCISGIASLKGSTSTAQTSFKWQGPPAAILSSSADSMEIQVKTTGKYILTVTQKQCTTSDTVEVGECALVFRDTVVEICASASGNPAFYTNYSVTGLNNFVRGANPSLVEWYADKLFAHPISRPDSLVIQNGDTLFAKISSVDASEMARAEAVFIVDTLPLAPVVQSLSPICQGFSRTLKASGSSGNKYTWILTAADSDFTSSPSSSDSVSFVAGNTPVLGKIVGTDGKGCAGDTGYFTVPVDRLPTVATVNKKPFDTLVYCITALNKELSGDTPAVGIGHWDILKNTDSAKIDSTQPRSWIHDFSEMKDTLVVEWVIENGVCPVSTAVLTVWPEKAYVPTVTLQPVPTVCEGTSVTYTAQPGMAAGNHPAYSFYDQHRQLLRPKAGTPTFSFPATQDSVLYVTIHSDYECLYTDTASSDPVVLDVAEKPMAHIVSSNDTVCVVDGPISVSAEKDTMEGIVYEWYAASVLINKSTEVETLRFDTPEESGTYILRVYNSVCPSAYDTVHLKIYEKPELSFPSNKIDVLYADGKTVPLPLQLASMLQPDDIRSIVWSPVDYLGYTKGDPPAFTELSEDTNVQQPLYKAQDKELSTLYWVTVKSGPEKKGCESTASVLVHNYIDLKVPNAFSPNGDGLNEYWIIEGMARYPQSKVLVFNRWGSVVFQDKTGYLSPWDGYVSGEKLAQGTYYYIIELLGSPDGTDHLKQGSLTIVH